MDIIQQEFARVFSKFVYPFKTADQNIRAMRPQERAKYLKEARKINESKTTIAELNEICRHLYYQLAVEAKTDEERSLYRGALLFASIWKQRFNRLSALDPVALEKSVEEANKRIDEIIN